MMRLENTNGFVWGLTMVDTVTHGACWVAMPAVAIATGTEITNTQFVAFVVGTIAPDIGEFVCWAGMRKHGEPVSFRYTKRMTQVWRALEHQSPHWLWVYKALHSVSCQLLIITALLAWDEHIALFYGLGVAVHITLDIPSHRIYSLFWPWPICHGLPSLGRWVVQQLVGKKIQNWWEWPLYRNHYWKVIGASALVDTFGLWHLLGRFAVI